DYVISALQEIQQLKNQFNKEKQDLIEQFKKDKQEWHREREDLIKLRSVSARESTTDSVNSVLKLLQNQGSTLDEDLQEIKEELTADYETKFQIELSAWKIREQELKTENIKLRAALDESEMQKDLLQKSFEE